MMLLSSLYLMTFEVALKLRFIKRSAIRRALLRLFLFRVCTKSLEMVLEVVRVAIGESKRVCVGAEISVLLNGLPLPVDC